MPDPAGRRIVAALIVVAAVGAVAPSPSAATAPRYVYPVPGGTNGGPHTSYPAADIFNACGAPVVAPVSGTVVRVDRIDDWSPETDSPWARGGKSVAIRDAERVRHYLAHFRRIATSITVGGHVTAGQFLGRMGATGRASACHTHYGISPMCRHVREWWVRRGVVAPQPFLSDWRRGVMTSPNVAVRAWQRAHPGACADPNLVGAL